MAAEEQTKLQQEENADFESARQAFLEATSESERELIQEFEKNPDRTVYAESFQTSMLILKRLQEEAENNEQYRREMEAFYEEISKKSSVDLTDGANNNEQRFEIALKGMQSLSPEDLKRVTPLVYEDLSKDLLDLEGTKKRLVDYGLKAPNDQVLTDVAQGARLAELYHREFGDSNVNYFDEVKSGISQMNAGFQGMDFAKGRKFAMLAVMTAATGGSNLLVKGSMFAFKEAISNPKVQEVAGKGVAGFRGFLENRGVNLAPFDKAYDGLKEKAGAIAEKAKGSKWGKRLIIGGTVAAVATAAVVAGDIDIDDIKVAATKAMDWATDADAAVDAGPEVPEGYSVKENADWSAQQMEMYADRHNVSIADMKDGLNGYQLMEATKIANEAYFDELQEKLGWDPEVKNIRDIETPPLSPDEVREMSIQMANEAIANGATPDMQFSDYLKSQMDPDGVRATGPIQDVMDSNGPASHATSMQDTPGNPNELTDHQKYMQDTPGNPSDAADATDVEPAIQDLTMSFQEMVDGMSQDDLAKLNALENAMQDEMLSQTTAASQGYSWDPISMDVTADSAKAFAQAMIDSGMDPNTTYADWHASQMEAPGQDAAPASHSQYMQDTPGKPGDLTDHQRYMQDTPGKPGELTDHQRYMQDTPGANARAVTPVDNDFSYDIPASDFDMQTVEIPKGGSLNGEIEKLLTEKLGTEPSQQMVNAISKSIILENGIEDPRLLQAGQSFEFDFNDFSHVTELKNSEMEIVEHGAGGAPSFLDKAGDSLKEKVGSSMQSLSDMMSNIGDSQDTAAPTNSGGHPDKVKEWESANDKRNWYKDHGGLGQ